MQNLLKKPLAFLDNMRRRSSQASAMGLQQYGEDEGGGVDRQLAAAHYQHGMVAGSGNSSMPQTPGSNGSMGSWVSDAAVTMQRLEHQHHCFSNTIVFIEPFKNVLFMRIPLLSARC